MIDIELIQSEYDTCQAEGRRRMVESAKLKLNHATTYKRDEETRVKEETIGCCGEMVLAKGLGMVDFQHPINTFHDVPDLPAGIEARATDRLDGRLIIRSNDPDDRWYFLIVGGPLKWKIVGFIQGKDAKQDRWLANPNGYRQAWFVPQSALTPANEEERETA